MKRLDRTQKNLAALFVIGVLLWLAAVAKADEGGGWFERWFEGPSEPAPVAGPPAEASPNGEPDLRPKITQEPAAQAADNQLVSCETNTDCGTGVRCDTMRYVCESPQPSIP